MTREPIEPPPASPWLETREAAAYTRCLDRAGQPSRRAFRSWAKRHQIALIHRGRRVLVARVDLDQALGIPLPLRLVYRARRPRRCAGRTVAP